MTSAENQPTAPCGDVMDEEGQAAHLPDDVLAAVLRRVPPRWLAASRCVCRAWRDAVDGRRLLRADLLPLTLAGLFVHFNEHKYPEFLARPSSSSTTCSRAVSGDLSFLPSASPHCGYFWEEGCVDWRDFNIQDHCNGLLLLLNNSVVNPATRRWSILPTCPAEDGIGHVRHRSTHLVYDPTVSPHYEVFKIPTLYRYYGDKVDPSMEQSEWPPSLCKMYVFSSKSGCWEERCFSREGDAAGTVSQMRVGYWPFHAVYFRGALYVHCNHNFLMRISLSSNTYSVIKPPMDLTAEGHPDINIARSKNGVYIVAYDYWPRNKYLLRVWILNESCGQVEWMLKHNIDLKHVLAGHHFCGRDQWILEDINYKLFRSSDCQEDSKKATTKENTEWNSDEDVEEEDMIDHSGYLEDKNVVVEKKLVWNSNNDNALNYGGMSEDCYSDEEHYDDSRDEDLRILGFHPYKEIIFLSASERICLAYHLNGSKIEELGNIYPKEYIYFKELVNEQEKIKSFPYTPCWMEEFPGSN
ncbi:hypothetical protein QYE76_000599 [Lolium multiflorum]|uniref:F-box domain-containing protein n=1 Tax=Lolium multiflorum TaxID=4521 RepID=A0AAD8VXT5_LOLMU|nr:hypothetical protein QYE76_000599 [Lolium multiflorum]